MRNKTIIYIALLNIVLLLFAYLTGFFSRTGAASDFNDSLEKLETTIKIYKEATSTLEYVQFLKENPQLQYKSIDKLLKHVNFLLLTMIGKTEKCKSEYNLKELELYELTVKAKKLQTEILNLAKMDSAIEKMKTVNETAKIEFKTPKKEKRVISFSLYGNNPKYIVGAFRNV